MMTFLVMPFTILSFWQVCSRSATFVCLLVLLPVGSLLAAHSFAGFDKSAYFSAIASKEKETVDGMLKLVSASEFPEKAAYEAALLMKKAGFLSSPSAKLRMFKQGRNQLEAAIAASPDNPEPRLLRLMIQENAPKIVGYRHEINTDAAFVKKWFKKMSSDVQQAARNYSRTSEVLKLTAF